MFWFPSDPKFIKLKKQLKELKILTSTYKGWYQAMVNIFASKYIRIGATIVSQFWWYYVCYCHLVSFGKNIFLRQIV